MVQSSAGVDRHEEPEPPEQRPAQRSHDPVESVVRSAAQRTVGLEGERALESVAAFPSRRQHHPGQGLSVLRGEAVGHERRFQDRNRRNGQSGGTVGGIQLVLHGHAVHDEHILPHAPTPEGGLHDSGLDGDGVFQARDREVAQICHGDLLHGGGNAGIEQRIRFALDRYALQLQGFGGQLHVEPHRAAADDLHAVLRQRPITHGANRDPIGAGADLPHAVAPLSVGDRTVQAAANLHLGAGDRRSAHCVRYRTGHRAAQLGGEAGGPQDECEAS